MTEPTTTTKPSYLGLLNAIAVGEAAAERYLTCWAEVTPSDEVRQVLRTIALREGEHAKAFEKRICELGFDVRPRDDDPSRAEIAASTSCSDREKFEALGLGQDRGDGPDVFASMFADRDIDIQTGALLGRYIAEERDSERMFRACYRQLVDADETSGGETSGGEASGTDVALGDVVGRLERIESTLEQLLAAR